MDFVLLVTMFGTLIMAVVFAALYFSPETPSPKNTVSVRPIVYQGNQTAFTAEEVSQHNRRNDCWIIVKDKVYDVTSYVEEHPGGDAILNHAGGDSTEGFYGPQHATRVFDMVDEFYIGELIH